MDKKWVVIYFGLAVLILLSVIYFGGVSNLLQRMTGKTILYGDMIAHYPLDVNDSDMITGKNGTIKGAVFVDGKVGNALKFSGIESNVVMGEILNIEKEDFSLSAWIKTKETMPMGIATKQILHQKGYSLGTYGGQVWFEIKDGSKESNTLEIEGTKFINDGVWHYIVLSADRDGDFVLYVDGEVDFSASGKNVQDSLFNRQDFVIGSYDQGYHGFVGSIDEVKIWRKALTIKDVEEEFLKAGGSEGELPEEVEVCSDSDGGVDYYVRGVCVDKITPDSTRTFKDQCGVEIDGIYQGKLLKEFSCEEGECVQETVPHECAKGCSAGVCK
jgi:hypothetical protein